MNLFKRFKRKRKIKAARTALRKVFDESLEESKTEIFIEMWRDRVNEGPHIEGRAIIADARYHGHSMPICIHIPFFAEFTLYPVIESLEKMKKGSVDASCGQLRFIYHTDQIYLEIQLNKVPNDTFFGLPRNLSKNLLCAEATKIIFRQGDHLYSPNFMCNPDFVSVDNFDKERTTNYYEFIQKCLNYRSERHQSTDVVILTNPEFKGTDINAHFEPETEAFLEGLKNETPSLAFNLIKKIQMKADGMKAIDTAIHELGESYFPDHPDRLYLVPISTRITLVNNGYVMDGEKRIAEILVFCANGGYQLFDYIPQRFSDENLLTPRYSGHPDPRPVVCQDIHV